MIMQAMTPLLSTNEFGEQLSKFIRVADIIISRLNGKFKDIKNNEVSLNTLLGDATQLRNYLENIVSLSPETVATLMLWVD